MQIRKHKFGQTVALLALGGGILMLSACVGGSEGGDDVAALDEKLVGKGSDPAMTGAVQDKILEIGRAHV